jgi:hypothetical protein
VRLSDVLAGHGLIEIILGNRCISASLLGGVKERKELELSRHVGVDTSLKPLNETTGLGGIRHE